MKSLAQLLLIILIFNSSFVNAQNNSSSTSSGNIYKDLSKDLIIKDAKFILVMGKNREVIDTTTLKNVNPNWLEKVNILTADTSQMKSKISSVEIYIRKKYFNNVKKLIDKK
jgi:hypothetical protein